MWAVAIGQEYGAIQPQSDVKFTIASGYTNTSGLYKDKLSLYPTPPLKHNLGFATLTLQSIKFNSSYRFGECICNIIICRYIG